MKALGIVLVVIGLLALVYGGITWTSRDTVVDAGPIEITKDKPRGRRHPAARRGGRRGRRGGPARDP